MTSSPKRNHANRINALKSTGPRSSKGKVISAMNSRRHGLTSRNQNFIEEQNFGGISKLMQAELNDETIAINIAQRIIQYERAQEHQKKLYLENPNQPNHAVEAIDQVSRKLGIDANNIYEHAGKEGYFFQDLKINDVFAIAFIKQLFIKYWLTSYQKYNIRKAREERAAVRYMKRATNQLIKSLKGLDAV